MRYDVEYINKIPILSVAEALGIKVNKDKSMCFAGHDRKTPSLSFNIKDNYWHCFGCGKGGNNIELVMGVAMLSYIDAIKWIDSLFGSTYVPTYHYNKVILNKTKQLIHNSSELSLREIEPDDELYRWFLDNCKLSDIARHYLTQRGLTNNTIEHYEIKDIINPKRALQKTIEKWGVERAIKSGLVKPKNEQYCERLIWWDQTILLPFKNHERITYIQGRRLKGNTPKYLNLRGITKPLFNLDILNSMKKGEIVYLCEGVFDALSASQIGLNAIGVLGASSFKETWAELFMNFQVVIIPDPDEAGNKFAEKAKIIFHRRGKVVDSIHLPVGQDLSEYLTSGRF
jgi:DNA primase catalytic core